MKRRILYLVAVLAFVLTPAGAQTEEILDLSAVGKDSLWKLSGGTAVIADVKGKAALQVSEGFIWLESFEVRDGVIEADLLGRSQPVQGSFLGIAFRVVDDKTHDLIYFRPFNFQSPDAARRSHAVQYVSHPAWPWQKLRQEHPDKYEAAVVGEIDGDEWFHVRIVVERPKVSVFVNRASSPSLVVDELGERAGGFIGLWAGGTSAGHFANLRVTRKR